MTTRALVDDVRVRDVMNANVATVHASHSMPLVASSMELERARRVPVIDDDRRVVGLITHRDILAAQLRKGAAAPAGVVDDEKLVGMDTESVVLAEMWRLEIGAALVTDGGRLVGVLSTMDACRLFSEHLKTLSARALRMGGAS